MRNSCISLTKAISNSVILAPGGTKFIRKSYPPVLARSSAQLLSTGMDLSTQPNSAESTGKDFESILRRIREFIPRLTPNLHKGQCGRVGVIGGSFEYTGAPYFAAISALKLGVDLVHVFCCREAGPVIKSYSPELIVHPFLDSKDVVTEIEPWLGRLHVLVVGPGLGRNKDVLGNVGDIIRHCKTNVKTPPPLVIDADGVYLISEDLELLKGYEAPVILTPNVVEFSRLSSKMGESDPLKMAAALNAVLVRKGPVDVIANGMLRGGPDELKCDVAGSYRRCGGQGDVLSGCTAGFVAWVQVRAPGDGGSEALPPEDPCMRYSWAAYGGCAMTRFCSRLAFQEKARGMTASDMIESVHRVFKAHFEV